MAEHDESDVVEILSVEALRAALAAHGRGERGPVRVIVMPGYAPEGTVGWVYAVEKANRTTVTVVPLAGGRAMRVDPFVLVEASDGDVEAYEATRPAVTAADLAVFPGSVVTLAGPGWRQPADVLWVVVATKGMTDVSVARLGGDNGRLFPKVPRALVTAVLGGEQIAAALGGSR